MGLRECATGSGASQWMHCAASVGLGKDIIEPEKEYAAEGTLAHHWAAKILTDEAKLEEIPNEEMRKHVKTYVDFVFENSPHPKIYVEERLPLLGTSGQLDSYSICNKQGFLFDLKFGIGKRLDASDNDQLAFYACALKEKYPDLTVIHTWIVQPRVEGMFEGTPSISQRSYPWQTLRAYKERFSKALDAVEEGKSMATGEWCQFCKAKGCCPIYVAYADGIDEEQENLPMTVADNLPAVGVERIARILQAKKRISSWFDKAEEYLLQLALQGVEVPGFKLAKKRSNRIWHSMMDENDVAEVLKERGVAEPFERKLISITKAEKLCDIQGLFEKPEGGDTLKAIK